MKKIITLVLVLAMLAAVGSAALANTGPAGITITEAGGPTIIPDPGPEPTDPSDEERGLPNGLANLADGLHFGTLQQTSAAQTRTSLAPFNTNAATQRIGLRVEGNANFALQVNVGQFMTGTNANLNGATLTLTNDITGLATTTISGGTIPATGFQSNAGMNMTILNPTLDANTTVSALTLVEGRNISGASLWASNFTGTLNILPGSMAHHGATSATMTFSMGTPPSN